MVQAAQKMDDMLRSRSKSDRLDVATLRGLCLLAQERPDDAEAGFTAMDLTKAIRRTSSTHASWAQSDLFGPGGKVDENFEAISDRIREQWKRVETLWKSMEEGVPQKFAIDGAQWHPRPEREIGGGTGKLTKYRLVLTEIKLDSSAPPAPIATSSTAATPSTMIHADSTSTEPMHVKYWCEEVDEAGWLTKQFTKAWSADLGRKHWMVWLAVSSVAAMVIYVLVITLLISLAKNPLDVLKLLLVLPVSCWIFWRLFGPLTLTSERRIVPAPAWLQSSAEDRLLEGRPSGKGKGTDVKLVRYVATCPLCKGTIGIRGGGWLFTGRLYGACCESPQEHKFRFDYKQRNGSRFD